jgi:RES domain-containing protein
MTPLPGTLGNGDMVGWRLDRKEFGPTWNSGEGAFRFGGRWNSRGNRIVYAALDPSTCILEVAVHKTFRALDIVPHILTSFRIESAADVHIVDADDVPNANWLRPGIPSAGQQAFGDLLTAKHPFVLIPSAVSTRSWNVIFDPGLAAGRYALLRQEAFALDTRLHPPA